MNKQHPKTDTIERPPVVAIMGHVDHGKSSLLDYIRKSNIVAGESGGITQHVSAYEVVHTDTHGNPKKITFIDTPGHAAFSSMRSRSARVADIAILIVSSEEGVKAQTKEAIRVILENNVPYMVAFTKIDRPNSNVDKVKMELMEAGVYVEGYGGDIPAVAISSITGVGIDALLETILLIAEFSEFVGNPETLASGFIIEANMDEKRGVSATLIIKNGTLRSGQFVVAGTSMTGTRILENGLGATVADATFSSPIRLTGFSELPAIGSEFQALETKRDAEEYVKLAREMKDSETSAINIISDDTFIIPIIIKSDVYGTAEAIKHQIETLSTPEVFFKVIKIAVGTINESDMQLALTDKNTISVGFHVDADNRVYDINGAGDITVKIFDVIYKITEYLESERVTRKPKKMTDEVTATLKVLKVFSTSKGVVVLGGRVTSGTLMMKSRIHIVRDGDIVGSGVITNLQIAKAAANQVDTGTECGLAIETKTELLDGDTVESYIVVEK